MTTTLLINETVSCAPLPPRENVAEEHLKRACSKNILRGVTLSVAVACTIISSGHCMDMCTIYGPENALKEGEKLWIGCHIGGERRNRSGQLDIARLEFRGEHRCKHLIYNPKQFLRICEYVEK